MEESFDVLCWVTYEATAYTLTVRTKNASFHKIEKALRNKFAIKEIYVGSSGLRIDNWNDNIFDRIIHDEIMVAGEIADVIVVYSNNEDEDDTRNASNIMTIADNAVRSHIVRHLTGNIVRRVIVANKDLSESFDITRKKRKDRNCDDVIYTWKKNKHVEFRSEKKAKLFLLENVNVGIPC